MVPSQLVISVVLLKAAMISLQAAGLHRDTPQ